jgi:Bacterial PH domain
MNPTPAPTFRIVPRRWGAVFYTAFLLLFFGIAFSALMGPGRVTVNGSEVYGAERAETVLEMRIVFFLIPMPLLIWNGRRLLPGSPLDFLELGPSGLTVGGLFGKRHIAWADIAGFSVGNISTGRQPITWIKVEPRDPNAKPIRFFMGGYVKFAFFTRMKTLMRPIAEWLDQVRASYVFNDTAQDLPPPPEELVGRITRQLPETGSAMTSPRRPGVIER